MDRPKPALVGLVFTLPTFRRPFTMWIAMGSGERMIPLIFGFIVAAGAPTGRPTPGSQAVATTGYLIKGAGTILGARDGGLQRSVLAMWLSVTGFGLGLGLITAASVAVQGTPRRARQPRLRRLPGSSEDRWSPWRSHPAACSARSTNDTYTCPWALADVGATVRSGVFLPGRRRPTPSDRSDRPGFPSPACTPSWVSGRHRLAAAVACARAPSPGRDAGPRYDAHLDPDHR